MQAEFDWFQYAISGLSDLSKRLKMLSDLKRLLEKLPKNKTRLVAHSLNLVAIFDCLHALESEPVRLACDILYILLPRLEMGLLLDQYGENVLRALREEFPGVKDMILNVLYVMASNEEMAARFCEETEMIVIVTNCLGHHDYRFAELAVKLLVQLGKFACGREVLFSSPILYLLKSHSIWDFDFKTRMFEIVVGIGAISPEGLADSKNSGFLSELLRELKRGDVMTKLMAINILARLAPTKQGIDYLEEKGIFQFLNDLMAAIQPDSPNAVLLPGLIGFFGNTATEWPGEMFDEYPEAMSVIFEAVNNPSLNIRRSALEKIGWIATTIPGKKKLNEHGEKMECTLHTLRDHITNLGEDEQLEGLKVLRNLILLTPTTNDYLTLQLTRGWFEKFSCEPFEIVFEICKTGEYPEHRLAALHVMQGLSNQMWGLQKMHDVPGLIKYLKDQESETDDLCKAAKVEMMEIMADTAVAEDVFGSEIIGQLKVLIGREPN